ncbi:SLATT domain-containing protein [Corynebacterium casei]|uniref:SLATT domain-containing protein n=1 Tax=Corynebacterium casei TaxID=160386 RepID=UPI003FD5BFA8
MTDKSNSLGPIRHQLTIRQDRILYTYRTQEKAADRFHGYESKRKWLSLILTAITAGTFITVLAGWLFSSEIVGSVVTAAIAMIATGVSFAADYLRFSENAEAHSKSAVKLREVYGEYESLVVSIDAGVVDSQEAAARRDKIFRLEQDLLEVAPRTTTSDYDKANTAINGSEKPVTPQNELESRTPSARRLYLQEDNRDE